MKQTLILLSTLFIFLILASPVLADQEWYNNSYFWGDVTVNETLTVNEYIVTEAIGIGIRPEEEEPGGLLDVFSYTGTADVSIDSYSPWGNAYIAISSFGNGTRWGAPMINMNTPEGSWRIWMDGSTYGSLGDYNRLGFWDGDANVITLDGDTDSVGIRKTDPSEALDVAGNIKTVDLNATGDLAVGGTLKGASLIKASQGFNITYNEDDFAEVSITNTNNGTEASTRLSFFNNIGEAFTIGKLGSNVEGSENNVVVANLGSGDMIFSQNLNSPFSTPVTEPNSFKWVLNDLSNLSIINQTTWMELNQNGTLNVAGDTLVGGDLSVGGVLGGGSPLSIHYNGIEFQDKTGNSQFKIYHNHKEENLSNIPDAFDHSLIFETSNISNDYNMEVCFWDTPLEKMSMCINEGAPERATTVYRSFQIVGNEKVPNNENFTLCEDANYVDCDTPGTGPDLLVDDDIEAKGSIYANEGMTTGNLSVIEDYITIDGIECVKEEHTFVVDVAVDQGVNVYKQNFTILNCGNSTVWSEPLSHQH